MLKRGDVAIVDFKGSHGREQFGIRPALVLTSAAYHETSSTAIVVPITTKPNPWPFKLALPQGGIIQGYLLVDQVKCVDRVARGFRVVDQVPSATLDMVTTLLDRLIKETS